MYRQHIFVQPQHLIVAVVCGIFFIGFLFTRIAHADNPTVTSLTVSPSSISNDYNIAVAWTITGGDGHDLYFNCPIGVTIKVTGGSSFPCNTRQSTSADVSGSAGFVVTNVSGTSKNLVVTVYPKSAGVDYDSGAQTASVIVTTAPQPLTDASISTMTPASGAPFTISWKGIDIPGANIQFECVSNLTLYDGSSTTTNPLPCNKPAYTTDQAQSGSVTVTPVNATFMPITFAAHVFPAIASGVYDSTHAMTVTGTVAGMVVTPDPSVSSFTASSSRIASGDSIALSWSTAHTSGVNIQITCNSPLSFWSVVATSTSPLPCNSFSTPVPYASVGTTTIMVANTSPYDQNVNVILLPINSSGTSLLGIARTVNFTILASGVAVPSSNTTSVPTVTTPATQQLLTGTPHMPFTQYLVRSSRKSDVKGVQQFLAQSLAIYPEGSVTGYYGPATERAVGRFQEKYLLAKKGGEGYGSVGPKTRAKMNTLNVP